MEFIDKRAEKRAAEATEVVERLEAVVADGDVEEIERVSGELCGKGPHAPIPFKKTVKGEKQGWKDKSFVAVNLPVGNAQLLMVRAVGLRTDDKMFIADYAIPPIWVEGEDFNAEAMKRLETFLACSCDSRGRCKFHGEALPGPKRAGKWLEADIKRLNKIQNSPLPESAEVLMKAEAARAQSRIVVPGRG
jgi:hypothetical protein